jgi:hypothetical protein
MAGGTSDSKSTDRIIRLRTGEKTKKARGLGFEFSGKGTSRRVLVVGCGVREEVILNRLCVHLLMP